jgi:hypothetical protein
VPRRAQPSGDEGVPPCLPRNQTIITSAIKPFLDGDFSWRMVNNDIVERTNPEHTRQSSEARSGVWRDKQEQSRVQQFAGRRLCCSMATSSCRGCHSDSRTTPP